MDEKSEEARQPEFGLWHSGNFQSTLSTGRALVSPDERLRGTDKIRADTPYHFGL
jgi:hypothetical protein